MSQGTVQFWIDPAYGLRGAAARAPKGVEVIPLVPEGGEYAQAVKRLAEMGAAGPAGRGVPDEVFLHLFAYELLERMRDFTRSRADGGPARLVLPFWPECLFEAAGLHVHGAREIQSLFPKASEIIYVPVGEEALAVEARRVLGEERFDAGAYLEALQAKAAQEGWKTIETDGG